MMVGLLGTCGWLCLLPLLGFLIKLDSRGPILYRAARVGQGGRGFTMYKFRSMYATKEPLGASVSPQDDPRVTEVGRWLRRTKLDELPQFWNLLKGDMTLIGPRPEAPDLAADYPEAGKEIFDAKPGLIGPNQIIGRNEEEWYPPGVNHRQYYLKQILPGKIVNDLAYLHNKSFWGDLKLLAAGVWATVSGVVGRQHLTDNRTQMYMLGLDTFACVLSLTAAFALRFGRFSSDFGVVLTQTEQQALLTMLPLAVLFRLPVFIYFGFYRTLIRHLGLADLRRVADGVLISSGFLLITSFFVGVNLQSFGRSVCLIDWLLLTALLLGYRTLGKIVHRRWQAAKTGNGSPRRRVLIWGADDDGVSCHRFLQEHRDPHYEVVGFLDSDPKLHHRFVGGVKVLGDQTHLEMLKQLYKIQEIYVTTNGGDPRPVQQLTQLCQHLSLRLLRFKPQSVEEITVFRSKPASASGFARPGCQESIG